MPEAEVRLLDLGDSAIENENMMRLYVADSEQEAMLLKMDLDQFDISCSIINHVAQDVFDFSNSMQARKINEIWVLEKDYSDAKTVLDAFLDETQYPEDEADWTCASCGETVDGVFDMCWNCQSPRPEDETTDQND